MLPKGCFLLLRCQGFVSFPAHTEDVGCGWDILQARSRTRQRGTPGKSLWLGSHLQIQGYHPTVHYRDTVRHALSRAGARGAGLSVPLHTLCQWFWLSPS